MAEFKILNPVIAFGEKKYNETVTAVFKYEGDKNEVSYVNPGCGCTTLKSFKDGEIIFELDLKAAGGKEGTFTVINKGQTIYLDKDIQEFIADEKGLRVPNPAKRRINLSINGTTT